VNGREFSKIVPNHCPRLGMIAPKAPRRENYQDV
jgi:hypothetical protein